MNFKWLGPLALLAALVIGDQIRINRPGHKYRLTVEVETPEGVKSASGVMAVHPDRSYSRGGHTRTKGDAVFVDLGGGKNLVALLAHIDDGKLDLDGINYVALRAYSAAGGKGVLQRHEPADRHGAGQGCVDSGARDLRRPEKSRDRARRWRRTTWKRRWARDFACRPITAEVVPNGVWPLDFGGPLGEPVTRGIETKLPWLNQPDNPAGRALQAAGLPIGEAIDPKRGLHAKIAMQARAGA